ncbi:MAG: type II toxin-antitoxin system HicA family toxin [Alphaproteobacteria bacterium]|nr:type II toxin-antitoxin system HicA family toxin [Alphaproteobacteria bacterium]MDA8029657.1 type II toxin-antitoxin system HicA family toxin [Alphaproteobacteria bacterium]
MPIKRKKLVKILKKQGIFFHRQGIGDHEIFICPNGKTFPITDDNEIPTGTLNSILAEIGMSKKEFDRLRMRV